MKKQEIGPFGKFLIILSAVLLLAILVLIFASAGRNKAEPDSKEVIAAIREDPDTKVVYKERETVVEVEKEITAKILRDGLRDMGLLVTEEYYFSEVVGFSSVKQLFNIDIGITETSYLAGYDGVIRAGVNFDAITVEKNDEAKTVTIGIPASDIISVDIDKESFRLYSEKNGLGNPLSVADFNASLLELENNARAKALDKGILERADENAQRVISNFVTGLLGDPGFSVKYVILK